MPRTCTICHHPERDAIDTALAGGIAQSEIIAKKRVSKDAVSRHRAAHLPARLAKAKEAQDIAVADDLLAQLKDLRRKAFAILLAAEEAGDLRTALLAIREARACLETLLELEGELNRRPQINLSISAEWVEVRAVLLSALAPYPEARGAVAQALLEVEQ